MLAAFLVYQAVVHVMISSPYCNNPFLWRDDALAFTLGYPNSLLDSRSPFNLAAVSP